MIKVHFIIYVKDQELSTTFYKQLLDIEPVLFVPGMTEFMITPNTKLGLMPEQSIQKILKDTTLNPSLGTGIPRCEIYLFVDSPQKYLDKAIVLGAVKIEDEKIRDWGHSVAYCCDTDGHVLAFAKKST